MRILFAILITAFGLCCSERTRKEYIPDEPFVSHQIKLADSLGFVSLTLPKRFDTFFKWTHYSDCGKPCNEIKYRFQPKTLPIYMESGWDWKERTDSVEQFTISHSGYFPFQPQRDSMSIFTYMKRRQGNSISYYQHPIRYEKMLKIGERYVSAFAQDYKDSVTNIFTRRIYASTSVHGNIVNFDYELLSKDSLEDFKTAIKKMTYYLSTIKLSGRN